MTDMPVVRREKSQGSYQGIRTVSGMRNAYGSERKVCRS